MTMTLTGTIFLIIGILATSASPALSAPDIARIAGDLKVEGITFALDENKVQSKASPWGYAFNGTDINFSHNVGLGVTDPLNRLEVLGTVKASQFSGDGSGLSTVWKTNGNSNTVPGVDFIGNTDGRVFEIRATSVGINTSSPTTNTTFDVNGNIGATWMIFHDRTTQKTAKTDCMGRYEDNGNGTVTDCRSGLVWLKDASCLWNTGKVNNTDGFLTWSNAIIWTADLATTMCGLTDNSSAGDWRLPTKTEWMAMLTSANKQSINNPALTNDAGTDRWKAGINSSFINVPVSGDNWYWSNIGVSTNSSNAWGASIAGGIVSGIPKASKFLVWPVRAGQ